MNMVELFLRDRASSAGDMGLMVEPSRPEFVIDREPVGDNDCPWSHVISNERLDSLSVDRCHTAKANPSQHFLSMPFNSNKHQGLALCAATPCSFSFTANKGFVHFDTSCQSIPPGSNHDTTKFLQPCPSGLVAPKPISVTQVSSAQAGFLRHHHPHDVKPKTQRFTAVLKHRAGCCRDLSIATVTMQQALCGTPRFRAAALRTRKSARPSHPLQVRRAVRIRRKPLQKLLKCTRIWVGICGFHDRYATCCGHLSQSARQVCLCPDPAIHVSSRVAALAGKRVPW